MWSSYHNRWVTSREKAASLGFPVYSGIAASAGVQELDWDTMCPRLLGATSGHQAIGNSMCVPNVGVMLLVALSCAEPLTEKEAVAAKQEISHIVAGLKWSKKKHALINSSTQVVSVESILKPASAPEEPYLPFTRTQKVCEDALVLGEFVVGKFLSSQCHWGVICGRQDKFSKKNPVMVYRSAALFMPRCSPDKELPFCATSPVCVSMWTC